MNQRRLLALAGALLLALPGCAPASSGESPAPEGTYQVYYSAMGDEDAPAAVDSAAYTLPEDAPPVPALLQALLTPWEDLKRLQDGARFTRLLALDEEYKGYPWGAVWDEACRRAGVPEREAWLDEVEAYERDVLLKRA